MDELEKDAYDFMNNRKNPFQKKQELIEQYQKRKPEKLKTAEEMGIVFEDSTFDHFREVDGLGEDDEITITFSYDEWYEIWMEAEGHLNYWGADSKAVEMLGDILDKYKEETRKGK